MRRPWTTRQERQDLGRLWAHLHHQVAIWRSDLYEGSTPEARGSAAAMLRIYEPVLARLRKRVRRWGYR